MPRLELAAGEQVVIRGRSGGGKTTLLNVIAGLATVDEGGSSSTARTSRACPRRPATGSGPGNIGFVFQTFNLLAGFTALENVLLGMTFTGQRNDPQAGDRAARAALGWAIG